MLELQHERPGLRSDGMNVQTAVTGYRSFLRLAQAGLQCNLFAICQVFSPTKNPSLAGGGGVWEITEVRSSVQ